MAKSELEKSWLARYERWATLYKEDHLIAGWSAEGLSRRLALVLRLLSETGLKTGSLVLDLGAGPGTYTRAIRNIGHRCLGLDYSWKVVEIAKRRDQEGSYIQAEAYHLPFQNESFVAVVCIGVLQSLAEPKELLREIKRVLAPGGALFLDGLNSLFWLHRLRRWTGERRRMNYIDPYQIREESERMGFSQGRLHWLARPKFYQDWLNESGKASSSWLTLLFGYAFLLQVKSLE